MSRTAKKIILGATVVATGAAFVALQARAGGAGQCSLGDILAKLWHFGLFVFFWVAVYAAGRGAARLLFGRTSVPPELATALGVVVFGCLGFGLCAAKLAYGGLAKGLVIAAVGGGAIWGRKEWARLPGRVARWREEVELPAAALAAAAFLVVLPIALTAAHPPTYIDALVYHLAVPKVYAGSHGFVYLPHNVFASMPLGGSLFYLWPYLWDGLITAKASHLVVSVLAWGLTYRLARRWLDQYYATLAAVLVILTPIILKVVGGAHNDHFLVLFVVASLYVYFNLPPPGEAYRRRSCAAAGIFLGAALAVKYSAFAAVAAFGVVLIYDVIRKRTAFTEAAIVMGAAAFTVLPWLIKAFVERGNPVFPLLFDVFGGRDFTAEQARRLIAWQSGIGRGRGLTDWLLLPYRISVEGGVTYEYFAGRFLPFLLPLAALAAVFFRKGGRIVAFGWCYLAAWALGPQQLRFLDGAVPAFAIAASGALATADQGWAVWARRAWRTAVAVAVFVGAIPFLIPATFSSLPRLVYLTGMDREDFLRQWVAFYPAQEYINEELPPGSKVLLAYYNQTLYLKRPAVYDAFLEASAILIAAETARDETELYELTRRWGVTHVHVYYRGEPYVKEYYAEGTIPRFRSFVSRYGAVVYEDDFGAVYELVGEEARTPAY